MAGYLGAKPAVNGIYTVDEFTSSGGTTYTLSRAPGTKNNIQVNAGGLAQYPSAYSVSGTTLTLSGVPSGQKVVVRHMGETILYPALDDGIVTNAKLADDAVGLAEMAPGTDGNIITYDASGNPAAVATGTAGQVLTSAGAGAPPTFAAAAAGGGKLKQVVSTALNTIPSTTSTSWVDISGFTVTTATLDASTSKLLIFGQVTIGNPTNYSTPVRLKITPSGGSAVYPYIGSGAPDSGTRWNSTIMPARSYSENSEIAGTQSFVYLFQASSTVAHTINLQWLTETSGTAYLNRAHTETYGRGTSSITVQEIGA